MTPLTKSIVTLICVLLMQRATEPPKPARYISGELPRIPIQAIGAGEVFVELALTRAGTAASATILRTTPPFTDAVVDAVRGWRFEPARDTDDPRRPLEDVPSTVLVAAIFRPPVLLNGPVVGTPPKDVGAASITCPSPASVIAPAFPVKALAEGVVLVAVDVAASGAVADAHVIVSAPGFDAPALNAARQWTFRPARLHGRPSRSIAYLLFAFRQPVT
jgi:TonB family protein